MIQDSDDPVYYVYAHSRNDTGEVFYYGKGKGRRAFYKYRNRWHDFIVKKIGMTITILRRGLTDSEAKSEEMRLIREALEAGIILTNQTPGGDGVGGESSKRGGSKSYMLKLGIHAPGVAAKGGRAGAKKMIETRTGLFGRSKYKISSDGRKAGKIMYEHKLGIFSYTDEEFKKVRSKGGKKASMLQKETRSGIFGLSNEERSKNATLAGKITSAQRWKCLECSMVSTPGNLGRHQKDKNHSGKERIT